METKEASGRSLVDHWNWAADKGLMNKNTANGLRAACSQVLGVLENWEEVDVRSLNVDELFTRFQNLRMKDFKPQSLDAYKKRFRIALDSFLSYLDDPAKWRPSSQERAPRVEKSTSRSEKSPVNGTEAVGEGARTVAEGWIEYPFPLPEGRTARLRLPRDLKRVEVRRLTAFMETLTVDFHEAEIVNR